VSEFESSVESLLDSLDDSNASEIQSKLTSYFRGSESDDDLRTEWAKQAYSMTNRFDDDRRSLLLLAAALEMSWPEYPLGDGYFREPSDLAAAATVIGINNPDDALFKFSKQLDPCKAIEFFDLGVVSSNSVSSENVSHAISRSNLDPVLAVAAVSGVLNRGQIMEALSQIEVPGWLSAALVNSDGWFWPDWQYAFEQASFNCEPSVVFWEILLEEIRKNQEDESSELSWIVDFMQEFEDNEGLEPDVSESTFELLSVNSSLRQLALDSKWEPLIEALDGL